MASRRTILILFSLLSAFVVSSESATTVESTISTDTTKSSTAVSSTVSPSTPTEDTATAQSSTAAPTTPVPTTAAGDTEGFEDLAAVDYIIIGVTCAVCAGIILGAIIIVVRKRMSKDKEDASSLVNHGHHPEYITELGGGVTNYKIEH